MKPVGVFGLGIIGAVWARHYESFGCLTGTWNRSPRPGAPRLCASPLELGRAADILHIVVADPAAVEAVLAAVRPALGPGKLVAQSSTIDPDSSRRLRALVESTGAAYVEAPFTGSKPAAEQRKTVFYVSGPTAAKAQAEPALALLSELRLDCGEGERAAALKLAMNLNLACMMQALGESLAFARRAGLDDELFFAALRRNAGWSGLAQLKEPKLRARDWSPQFSVKHMAKDMRLALATTSGRGLPMAALARELLERAAEAGLAEEDYCALARRLE